MDRRHLPAQHALRLFAVVALAASWIGLPPTAAAADAPNSCAGATGTSPRNAWLSGTIDTATDVDWYRFSLPTTSRALVTLGNLPADYDLYLYGDCSTLIASSRRDARQFDELYRLLPAGAYRVKVVGYLGAHAAAPYALRLRTLPWGIPVLSSTTWTDGDGNLHVAGEVLNNTAEPRRWIQVDATLLDSAGAPIASAVGYVKVATLAPRARAPFEIVTPRPAGFARASLAVCTPASGGGCALGQVAPSAVDLTAQVARSYLDAGGRRHYAGSISNGGTATARLVRSVVTLYDAYGNVRGLGAGFATPATLAAGASGTFDVIGRGTTSPNRSVAIATGAAVGCSTADRYTGAQENLLPPLARPSAAGRVALTFDMGGRMTPAVQILELLVANRVCATIFPTGAISRTADGQAALAIVKAHPELFELANHTMHHCDLVEGSGGAPGAAESAYCAELAPSPTEAQVKQELLDGEQWISQYGGESTAPLWRAPYGRASAEVRTWAAEAGWTKHVRWDIDTVDWKPVSSGGPTARSMALKVVNGATSGSIVLLHLGGYETLDALQAMIDGLRSRGYTLTTVSDLAM